MIQMIQIITSERLIMKRCKCFVQKQLLAGIVLSLIANTNAFVPLHRTKRHQTLHSQMHTSKFDVSKSMNNDEILSKMEEMIFDSNWKQNQFDILNKIDKQHQIDVESSSFVTESKSNTIPISYDVVTAYLPSNHPNQLHTIAARTKQALLNKDEIKTIIHAAEDHWRLSTNKETSRFTYQRKGNSEAHISDLGPKIQSIINEMLQTKAYPLLRKLYPHSQSQSQSQSDTSTFSIYDALMIRYNANEAMQQNITGAGQPLHRDLGLYSINIAFNTNTSYIGGGTFFEHQLLQNSNNQPLKPFGIGHALIHSSNERHAGAATYQGIRDILVLFITERYHHHHHYHDYYYHEYESKWKTPKLEFNARLKAKAMSISDPKLKIMHHHLAVQMNPNDGEAWLYLAQSIRQYQNSKMKHYFNILWIILQCLEKASMHSSCDARVFNDLGLTWMDVQTQQTQQTISTLNPAQINEKIQMYLQKSIELHRLADEAGCQVGMDADAAKLNLGLHYANLDDFQNAVNVLKTITTTSEKTTNNNNNNNTMRDYQLQRVRKDAQTLCQFCERQMAN